MCKIFRKFMKILRRALLKMGLRFLMWYLWLYHLRPRLRIYLRARRMLRELKREIARNKKPRLH